MLHGCEKTSIDVMSVKANVNQFLPSLLNCSHVAKARSHNPRRLEDIVSRGSSLERKGDLDNAQKNVIFLCLSLTSIASIM